MSSSQPGTRRTADAAQTRDELERLRPGMVARYDAALPGARAAVLSRLLGAIAREPLPGLTGRESGTATFAVGPGGSTATFSARHTPGGGNTATFPAGPGGGGTATFPAGAGGDSTAPFPAGPGGGGTATFPAGSGGGGTARFTPGPTPAGGSTAVELRFPAEAAIAFAQASAGLSVTVHNGTGNHRPGSPDGRDLKPGERGGAETGTGGDAGADARPNGTFVDDPGTLVRLLWGDVPLAAEIDNSVANLALARATDPPQTLPTDLGRIEQLVVDGHPLHPCCRTRGGMTVEDVLTYAPEHSPVIRLRRLRVPADRWFGTAPPLLYAHPWQADRLRDRYPWLTDDGETGPGRPLMSLRTIALDDRHVKTAVDVQMTSAVRTVSPAAINNGPILSALLHKLTADLPIGVLAETEGGAVIVDGEPQKHLAYLTREAPRPAQGELIVPLAAMAASPLLLATVHDPYEWWALLSDRLFAPLVTVLQRGVALEAHGQNTLIVLKDHRPHRILYRDFGGVRVSAKRLKQEPQLIGDLPSDDPRELRTKLAAAAFGNAAADLVAAFTRHFGADPAKLWRRTAEAIRATGTADAAHLLNDPLPVKATTAMRLAATPLDDLWAYLDNPLAAV